MKSLAILGGGLAGACAVTLFHETVRKIMPQAPRMDLLGEQALSKIIRSTGNKLPSAKNLYAMALVGDIISNSIYYTLSGLGKEKNAWRRGAAVGLAAGIGALVLPKPMNLNSNYSNKSVRTQLVTVGLYLTGALIATGVMKLLDKRKQRQGQVWEERLLTSAMV